MAASSLLLSAALVLFGPGEDAGSCSYVFRSRLAGSIEIAGGGYFERGDTIPLAWSWLAVPGFYVDPGNRLRLGAVLGAGFANPDIEFVYGGRISYLVAKVPRPFTGGMEFGLESVWGTHSLGREPPTLFVSLSFESVSLVARGGRSLFEYGVGIQIEPLVRFLSARRRHETTPEIPTPALASDLYEETVAFEVFQLLVDRLLVSIDGTQHIHCELLISLRKLKLEKGNSLDEVLAAMRRQELGYLANILVKEIQPFADETVGPGDDAMLVNGTVEGVRSAIGFARTSSLHSKYGSLPSDSVETGPAVSTGQ